MPTSSRKYSRYIAHLSIDSDRIYFKGEHYFFRVLIKNIAGSRYFMLPQSTPILLHTEGLIKTEVISTVKSEEKKRHTQKLATNKKSTIFVQFSWNLEKMITSWGNSFPLVSQGLDKNCGFFISGQFLSVCGFFCSDLIYWLDNDMIHSIYF